MSIQKKFSLLAATRHVGWGGVSKLRMILEKLPQASVTLHGDAHSVAITRKYLGPELATPTTPPAKFDVALVINDPPAVNGIADLGAPIGLRPERVARRHRIVEHGRGRDRP